MNNDNDHIDAIAYALFNIMQQSRLTSHDAHALIESLDLDAEQIISIDFQPHRLVVVERSEAQ